MIYSVKDSGELIPPVPAPKQDPSVSETFTNEDTRNVPDTLHNRNVPDNSGATWPLTEYNLVYADDASDSRCPSVSCIYIPCKLLDNGQLIIDINCILY